jgi:hypothetical protein
MKQLCIITLTLLAGCGGPPPTPPTGSACASDANIRETCWTCASEPVCAWWASDDPAHRGCHARTDQMPHDDVVVVRLSDACNELPEGTDR